MTDLRREIFKAYSDRNEYELYKKADSAELLQALLNLLHLNWVSAKDRKYNDIQDDTDMPCDEGCFVHKHFARDILLTTRCICSDE